MLKSPNIQGCSFHTKYYQLRPQLKSMISSSRLTLMPITSTYLALICMVSKEGMTLMAYQSRTFPNRQIMVLVRQLIMKITSLTTDSKGRPQVFFGGNNNDVPDYPYIEIQAPSAKTEQTSLTRDDESIQLTFNINCYSNLPEDTLGLAQDIKTMVFDPEYKVYLDKLHIAVIHCKNSGESLSDFANMLDISAQSLSLAIRIRRQYKSNYFTIKNTNLGGIPND